MGENRVRVAAPRARAFLALLTAAAVGQLLNAGCSRETFDLLPPDSASGAGVGGRITTTAGAGGAATASGGQSGSTASGGASLGGTGGSAGQAPCLVGQFCTDGGFDCPLNDPTCRRCSDERDCSSPARHCDLETGRCVECRTSANDCAQGQVCDPLTQRCAKACTTGGNDCDSPHPYCDRNVCVACLENKNCVIQYGLSAPVCLNGYCVECYIDAQCRPEKPYCRALRCQAK